MHVQCSHDSWEQQSPKALYYHIPMYSMYKLHSQSMFHTFDYQITKMICITELKTEDLLSIAYLYETITPRIANQWYI